MLTDVNTSAGLASIGSLFVIAGAVLLDGLVSWVLLDNCAGAEDLCIRRLVTRRLPNSGDVSGVESDLTETEECKLRLTMRTRMTD